ncbi:MAG: heme lyase NrfEFG subunit NrfE, partial [Cytophagaceae bacterium]
MIAEGGLAALWLAAALAALQLVLGIMGVRSERTDLLRAVRPVAVVQGVLTMIAFAALIYLFVTVDLSVALVAANDASTKPLLYKFAGTWGNHEGSMLMWVTILGVAGGAVAILERRLNERTL